MSTAEFAYNISVTRTTSKNSHEIVDGFRPKQITDLIPIADRYKIFESASSFASFVASHVHELHEKISDKVAQNNANYTIRTYVRNILKTFYVGDVNELHACSADLFQILNKLNDNAYVIDFDISFTLNVEDLVNYKRLDFILLIDEPSLKLIF